MKLLIPLILLSLPALLFADIYKWVDENGRTHFSQMPPENKELVIEVIEQKTPVHRKPAARSGVQQFNQYLESERLEREEKRLQRKQAAEKIATKCNELQRRLSDLQTGGIVYYELDENGEREFWSDQRLNEEILELSKQLRKNC